LTMGMVACSSRSPAINTVKYTLSVLRLALNRAVRYGLVARKAATLVDPPRIPYRPMKVLSPEQAQRLLEVSRSDRLHALYVVALTLGLAGARPWASDGRTSIRMAAACTSDGHCSGPPVKE
jgi:integrase